MEMEITMEMDWRGRSAAEDSSRSTKETIGVTFAFFSAALYLASRFPQLIKNFRRKSTEGLSLLMFGMSILGNFLYGVSVLTNVDELHQWRLEMPFLLGSLGTMFLDITIFCQFQYYGEKKFLSDDESDESDSSSDQYNIQEYSG